MWTYNFSKSSLKFLEQVDGETKVRIKTKLLELADYLEGKSPALVDIKRLKGKWEGFYRLRVGKVRVILSFDLQQKAMVLHDIGFRGDIY